ncbi:199_t:CDS:2, partial [Funneliformis geosporum]
MFVRPSLVGSLGRSNWKSIKESISDHDDLSQIQEAFEMLHHEVLPEVEGKKTSKKILKQLKSWCERNENLTLPFDEDVDGYASDTSITPEEENSSNEMDDQDNDNNENYPILSPEINISSNSSSFSTHSENIAILSSMTTTTNISKIKGKSKMVTMGEDHDMTHEQLDFTVNNSDDSEEIQTSDGSDNEVCVENNVQNGPAVNEWISLGASVLDSLMGWLECPPLEGMNVAAVVSSSSSKQVNANAVSNNKNQTILDIPMQFIDLLTYPEIDPKASKKASFAVLREISFVRQRRKVLCLVTMFMFFIRFCSFDLFLVLLFASNCSMLFLMKNSGKVNVTMAKRAVRQRIGWAKQWAGSLFKNRANNVAHNNGNIKKSHNLVNVITNVNSNAHKNFPVNFHTANVTGIKVTPATPPQSSSQNSPQASPQTTTQTTMMSKSASQDAMQSGSMSDTTHGGSVSIKMITPKRGVFFRKSGQTGATPQTTKEDKVISQTIENTSLNGSYSCQQSSSQDVLIGSTNSPMHSSNPQTSPTILGGGDSSQPSNTPAAHQTSQIPSSPLQNGLITTLPEISQEISHLSMTNVPTATVGIVGNSIATSGYGSNHSAKSSLNIHLNQQQQINSSFIADSDLLVNDTYHE